VKLFSTIAVKKALDDVILDAFTAKTGITVEGVYDPTVQLLRRIDAGETFDVMIGVTNSFDSLGHLVDLTSRRNVARSGIGLAVPADANIPDISTTDTFVQTLLNARSVAYSVTGASGIYFAELLNRLRIADAINAKATIIEKGFIANALVDGRADVAIQQLSELLFVPEAQIAGPFPAEVQQYTEFSAALALEAVENAEARAFLEFLTSAEANEAYAQTLLDAPLA
jgi:molybdate transport system substrate-binding protein